MFVIVAPKRKRHPTLTRQAKRNHRTASPGRIPQAATPDDPIYANWRTATLDQFVAWNTGDFARDISTVHGNNSNVLLNRDYTKLKDRKA